MLETTQSFASFVYDLSVKEEVKDNRIHFKVLGLKPPQLSMPASGHAKYVSEHDGLHGTYDVIIEGIDGRANTFKVRITPKKIELLKAPS